ncbi:hypothetical protein [Brasilonema bromeliae]|uniref:Uncharacterized protein n=1 Tax=Brasilonema bromeliae SPC951 TaxID=385972 RepID=A0ABX1PF20_9CYAN|nr:hypothetical protein [Brasilonema bromeliae]NMG22523.1 hypothetical protein [Brasilonema bromeliae SPC951]
MEKSAKRSLAIAAFLAFWAIAGVFGWAYWQDAKADADRNGVEMTASYGGSCGPDYASVVARNRTSKTVRKVNFHLNVYERGNSENLNHEWPEWTYVLKPHAQESACFRLPPSARPRDGKALNLTLDARPWSVDYFAEGDFIPQ